MYITVERYSGYLYWEQYLEQHLTLFMCIVLSSNIPDPLIHNFRRPRKLSTSIPELAWLLLAYVIAASPISSLAKTIYLF